MNKIWKQNFVRKNSNQNSNSKNIKPGENFWKENLWNKSFRKKLGTKFIHRKNKKEKAKRNLIAENIGKKKN